MIKLPRTQHIEGSRCAPGNWTISIPEIYYQRMHRDLKWFKNKPNPKFCPFCGSALPKMRRKSPLPPNVAVISYDGDYCNTCGDRCMNCKCDPPESIWEEDK